MWTFYDQYLRSFYKRYPQVTKSLYKNQMECLLNDYFDWPGRLIPYFRKSGHQADLIVTNAHQTQLAWAKENDFFVTGPNWEVDIVKAQIKQYRPDILWGNLTPMYAGILPEIRSFCGCCVAWRGAVLDKLFDLSSLDCILVHNPNELIRYRAIGKRSEQFFPCFEPAILDLLPSASPDISISFVGSYFPVHARRVELLLYLVQQQIPIELWGNGLLPEITGIKPWRIRSLLLQAKKLNHNCPLLQRYRGQAWGLDMFKILKRSKITLNIHGDTETGKVPTNMRLFEAMGVGTLTFTEATPNLADLFEPEKQLVTFIEREDLQKKIRYYMQHDDEGQAIAKAGQEQIMRKHTAEIRSSQLLELFEDIRS